MAGGMATMLLCTLLFSCNNEDFLESGNPEKACDNICFGISSDKNVQTRGYAGSDDEGYTADRFVLRSDDSADTLCVRAIVSDGINVSGFEGEQALTRATPVGKDNFYDKFHVLAYWSKNGAPIDQFYMNTNASNTSASVGTGAIWSTEQIYYWPGADHSFQFYAWAPTDAGGLTTPSAPTSKELAYTVPAEATSQKDIVVATTNEIQGDNNAAVPLTFKHICTAVRFAVGSQMQPGSIKSVALKGVKNAGTYDMAAGNWSLGDATVNFSQTLNKETTGTETNGDAITSPEGTFMMLPQTLPAGATVEVVFVNANSEERTLTASIGSTEWTMGTTVTYRLSITPEYNFELTDENPVLDAHYEIFKTTLKVTDMPAGTQWTVTANSDATIILQSGLNDYAKQGFWTDRFMNNQTDAGSARGEVSFTGTGSGEFPIAIFVPENIGETNRSIDLSVKVADSDEIVETLVLTQLAPSWNGALGCERIESDPCQWGFYWSSDFKIIYDLTSCDNASRESIYDYIAWTKTLKNLTNLPFIGWIFEWIFGDNIPDLSFVSVDRTNIGGNSLLNPPNYIADKITIDLGSITTSGIALSTNDGQSNTAEIYNFEGISLVNDIISRVESIPGYQVSTVGTGVFPSHNASIACMKLNSWNVVTVQDNKILQLKTEKPSWYLPAQMEAPTMSDSEYPLSGTYWTSTAENNNQNAYIWNAGEESANTVAQRDAYHKVRAVRQKP